MTVLRGESPELSVIITTYNARETVGQCLASLHAQDTHRPFEVILVDSSEDDTGDVVSARWPEVRVLRFRDRKFCGDARNAGIEAARAEIIAFIDADCVADPGWVEALLDAHAAPAPAIGGAIGNAEPSNAVGWAAYFCEFSAWLPGTRAGFMKDIAGANMSYKKELLIRNGPFIEGTYCSDTEFHWRLRPLGLQPLFCPHARVDHRSINHLAAFLRHEFHHGLSFARVRCRYGGFGLLRRALYAGAFALIPPKLLAQITVRSLRTPPYARRFILSLPLLITGLFAWAAGECTGYLGGSTCS